MKHIWLAFFVLIVAIGAQTIISVQTSGGQKQKTYIQTQGRIANDKKLVHDGGMAVKVTGPEQVLANTPAKFTLEITKGDSWENKDGSMGMPKKILGLGMSQIIVSGNENDVTAQNPKLSIDGRSALDVIVVGLVTSVMPGPSLVTEKTDIIPYLIKALAKTYLKAINTHSDEKLTQEMYGIVPKMGSIKDMWSINVELGNPGMGLKDLADAVKVEFTFELTFKKIGNQKIMLLPDIRGDFNGISSGNGITSTSSLKGLLYEYREILTLNIDVKKEIKSQPTRQSFEPEMVFVEGGTFQMGGNKGSSDEKPVHRVTLSGFYIGKYEVTQKEWEEVMGNNPSIFKGAVLPVENVCWNDVQEYIRKLNAKTGKNYRLPSEAEWEYAARGGNRSKGYKYSGSNNIDEVACWHICSGGRFNEEEVGGFKPNELGIYDMSGNVSEWCQDWYGESYYKVCPLNNPQGPGSGNGYVIRGGSYIYLEDGCRNTTRSSDDGIGGPDIGFRLAMDK